jgi:GNAT superfamily N-acetyltransferase
VVAVAGLLIRGLAAWFGPAATLPDDRGRGAQQLLLRERIEAARAAGCRLLAVETGEPSPEH